MPEPTPASAAQPTREELIALCERGSVPEGRWCNRDTASAQIQLGKAWALLRAGCAFTFDKPAISHKCWWVNFEVKDFNYFEIGEVGSDHAYIPTAERLNEVAGNDWY